MERKEEEEMNSKEGKWKEGRRKERRRWRKPFGILHFRAVQFDVVTYTSAVHNLN